jgi:plastocyanin
MSIHPDFFRSRLAPRALVLLCLLGCAAEDVAAPKPTADAFGLYWSLTLDQHAIMLSTVAPHDTVRLTATPRDASGASLTDAPAIIFHSTDPERLQVDADGLVRALETGIGPGIIASLSIDGVTHTDTAFVRVTGDSAPPVLDTFSIHPGPADSTIWHANALSSSDFFGPKRIAVTARDTNGVDIPNIAVEFRSADTTIATIDQSGYLRGVRPGTVAIMASTSAFGVSMADTVVYTITNPTAQIVHIDPASPATSGQDAASPPFAPSEVTIAAGGHVLWLNSTGRDVDVVFDDPANVTEDSTMCFCGSGNMEAFGDTTGVGFDGLRSRRFRVAGTYHYHSTITGATGTVTVAPPPPR